MEYVLEDYYSLVSSIDPALFPLMTPHMDVVVRSFLPGWTTLTWNTMNIDAFLHRVQGSVALFKVMVTRVGGILKEKVYGTLQVMEEMSLFDVSLAASRMWVSTAHACTCYIISPWCLYDSAQRHTWSFQLDVEYLAYFDQ